MATWELPNRKEKIHCSRKWTRPKNCVKKINIVLTLKASAPSFLFSLCSWRALYHKLCLNVLIFKKLWWLVLVRLLLVRLLSLTMLGPRLACRWKRKGMRLFWLTQILQPSWRTKKLLTRFTSNRLHLSLWLVSSVRSVQMPCFQLLVGKQDSTWPWSCLKTVFLMSSVSNFWELNYLLLTKRRTVTSLNNWWRNWINQFQSLKLSTQ